MRRSCADVWEDLKFGVQPNSDSVSFCRFSIASAQASEFPCTTVDGARRDSVAYALRIYSKRSARPWHTADVRMCTRRLSSTTYIGIASSLRSTQEDGRCHGLMPSYGSPTYSVASFGPGYFLIPCTIHQKIVSTTMPTKITEFQFIRSRELTG